MVHRYVFLWIAVVCLCFSSAFAEDFVSLQQYRQLEERVQALENQLNAYTKCMDEQKQCIMDQNEKIAAYESRLSKFDSDLHRQEGVPMNVAPGLEIGVGGTMIMQATNNVNSAATDVKKKESRTDATYSADVTIGKKFEETGGQAFAHFEVGKGAGLEDNLSLYSNVNRDADDDNNARLTEFWYEQALLDDKAAFTFGKLDPTAYFDNNEVANDETTQFLGRLFRNSPAIEFPDNGAGLRFVYLPQEWLEIGYGIFDADSDWEAVGDNLFNIAQLTFKTSYKDLPGNYRLLAWNSNAYHTKWLDTDKTKEENYGFGLSFDQKVTDIVTLFTRYAWQNPRVYKPDVLATGDLNYSLAHSWSAGFQVEGKPWGRDNDVLAFAVGQAIASKDYKKAGEALDPARRAKAEGHLEAYYRYQVNDHLSLSPDFQYICNPFGRDVDEDKDSVFLAGMRAQIDF